MQTNDSTVLRYKLWMRLFLIFGVLMWVGVIALVLTSPGQNLDVAALIAIIFLLPTAAAALSANLSRIGYDAHGIEQHAFLRRSVQIGWFEVSGVKMVTVRQPQRQDRRFLMVTAPARRITTSGQYDGFEGLFDELERRVPAEKWTKE